MRENLDSLSKEDLKRRIELLQLQKEGKKLTQEQKVELEKIGLLEKQNSEYYAQTLTLLKEYNEQLERRAVVERDIGRINDVNSKILQQEIVHQKRIAEQARQRYLEAADESKRAIAAQEQAVAELNKKKDLLDAMLAGTLTASTYDEDTIARTAQQIGQLEEILEKRTAERAELEAAVEPAHAAADLASQKADAIEDGNKGLLEAKAGLGQLLTTTLGVKENIHTGLVGGLIGAIQGGKSMDDIMESLGGKAKDMLSPDKLGMAFLSKVFQSTIEFLKEFDKLSAEFRRNQGLIDKGFGGLEDRIANVSRANLRFGISMDEAFAAANALRTEMASFAHETDENQGRLIKISGLMGEFGVSASTTAQIFNKLSKGLGQNAAQMEKTSLRLMSLSKNLGIPPKIIMEDFNQASSELMKYGDNMIEVFEGLEEQTKETGLAMSALLGIAKQFDTFKDAGEAVGRLNAILGGPYLNALQMVYATEEERIQLLRDSVKATGRQFEDMARFEKQALMNAAGITDMNVAMQLFNSTDANYRQHAMDMKEMQEQAEKAQAVTDKLKQVMMSFAIALGPVVHVLGLLATALLYVMNPFGELARFFGADDDMISRIGAFTVAGYALAVMINSGWIPALAKLNMGFIKLKMTTFQILAVFAAAAAAFTFMHNLTEGLSVPLGILVTLIGALAIGMAAFWVATTVGLAAPMIVAGTIATAAAIGGAMGVASNLHTGRDTGPEGVYEMGERGAETIVPREGAPRVVDQRGPQQLEEGDAVLNAAQTKRMRESSSGGGDSAGLAAAMLSLQQSVQTLTAQLTTPQGGDTGVTPSPQQVIIEMDGKKVADQVIERINRKSKLTINRAV